MNRRTSLRAACVLLAPWLALTFAQPVIVRDCAMPGGAAAMGGMAGMTRATPAPAAADAPAAPSAARGQHDPAAPPTRDLSGLCCVSGCCAAAPVALTPANEIAWASIVVRDDAPAIASMESAFVSADHILPFANGPPAILS